MRNRETLFVMSVNHLFESIWPRGWRDTKSGWADWRFWIAEILVGGISAMIEPWLGIFAVLGLAVAVWIGATARASFKQRDEARIAVQACDNQIKDLQDRSPKFDVQIKGMAFDSNGGDLIVFATVVNIGKSPSSITSLKMQLCFDESVENLSGTHPTGINYNQSNGVRVTYRSDDALFSKGTNPIAAGGQVSGYVVFQITKKNAMREADGSAQVNLIITDAYGEEYLGSKVLKSYAPGYLPGTNPETKNVK